MLPDHKGARKQVAARGSKMTIYAVRHGVFGKAVIMDLNRPVVTHIHLDYHLFVPLGEGGSRFKVGDETHLLSSGQCIGVNPWQPHSYQLIDGCDPVLAIVMYLDPLWLSKVFDDINFKWHQKLNCVAMSLQIERAAARLAAMMMGQFDKVDAQHQFNTLVQNLCLEFVDQDYRLESAAPNSKRSQFKVPVDFRLRKSLAYMQENMDSRCSLDMVARQSGMSRPWFFHRFREQTGITPNMYWDSLRMDAAFSKLSGEDTSICNVSFDLGFSSQSNFTRFFVNHFNAAPSEFRTASSQV